MSAGDGDEFEILLVDKVGGEVVAFGGFDS